MLDEVLLELLDPDRAEAKNMMMTIVVSGSCCRPITIIRSSNKEPLKLHLRTRKKLKR
jgi:hypothetical protein